MSDYEDKVMFYEDFGETTDETSTWTIRASFADGTSLTAQTKIHRPPPEELTPREVEYYDPIKGKTVTESDDGQTEARELEAKTTAYRMLDQIRTLIKTIPLHPKQECPGCKGNMVCPICEGIGCEGCNDTGMCGECNGRGFILSGQQPKS